MKRGSGDSEKLVNKINITLLNCFTAVTFISTNKLSHTSTQSCSSTSNLSIWNTLFKIQQQLYALFQRAVCHTETVIQVKTGGELHSLYYCKCNKIYKSNKLIRMLKFNPHNKLNNFSISWSKQKRNEQKLKVVWFSFHIKNRPVPWPGKKLSQKILFCFNPWWDGRGCT